MSAKNILFDIGHPAHVHLFKNFIRYLKNKKFNVIVVSREKDVTVDLLNYYKIESIRLSRAGIGPLQLLSEVLKRDLKIFRLHLKYKFDLAFGTSYSIAHLSALSKVKSFVFEEDDDHIVPIFAQITYPFATGIIIPSSLKYKKWAKKRIVHNSYHELAYLHPDHFSPDIAVPKKYGLKPSAYIIVRSSSFRAHHDFTEKGLIEKTGKKIYKLLEGHPIIDSKEGQRNKKINPWDMHHLLAYAKMLITDSQTMTMEAAVLGIPSIRYNSFVGKISVLEELEHQYGLTFGFRPGEESQMEEKIEELLNKRELHHEWQLKREKMLKDKINFSQWLIDYFQNYL